MRAVLFDMDGVLFDSERAVLSVWEEIGAEMGLSNVREVFLLCVGRTRPRMRETVCRAWPELDFTVFDNEVRARFSDRWGGGRLPLKPGAAEILHALKAQGVPLALASSTNTSVVRRELDEAGLLGCFDAVVGGDRVSRSKPDPEIFLAAAALLRAAPEESFVIEDSFNGIRAAHAGGFRAVMVPDLLPPDEEMRQKSEVIVNDLFEALRWLEKQ